MAVHRALGPGFLESVYQKALAVELASLGISFREQAPLLVTYKGQIVGEFIADFILDDRLVVELKSSLTLATAHEVQLVNYLNATGVENGLLINFGAPSLEFRRKFKNSKNPVNLVHPVKKSAFTLLELMVAMAIMALLLVLLLNMVDSATKLWRVNENRVDSYREARAALGIMARDLENALAGSTNTNHFLVNESAFPVFSTLGGALTDTNNGGALFFLSALPAKAQENGENKSDVCQVGYFLALSRTPASTNQTLNLYRYFRSSDETFTNLTAGTLFLNPSIGESGEELLARHIVGLSVRAYTLTNNSLVKFSASTNTPMPDLMEISISAINQDAAKKLDNTVANWTNTSSAIIRPVLQTFTTRIQLNRPQQGF